MDGYTVIINHKWEQLGYNPVIPLTQPQLTISRIQVSDGLVGMFWSGVVTFLILLFMEAAIVLYRKLRGIPDPEFQLILDQDIILDHEIGDDFAFRTKENGTNRIVLMGMDPHREARESTSAMGELEARNPNHVGMGEASRLRRFV